MLQRIARRQAKVGMFVESLEAAWIDTPFLSNRFAIKNEKVLAKVLQSPVETIVIDTDRGIGPGERPIEATTFHPPMAPPLLDADTRLAMDTLRHTSSALSLVFSSIRDGQAIDPSQTDAVVDEVADTMRKRPRALLGITRLKSKDEYSFLHSVAVCGLMTHFGRFLRMEENVVRELGLAGLLHDIGKVAIPKEILGKRGALSEEEMHLMRTHPEAGLRLLEQQDVPDMVREICLRHHERIDGRGYPDGLSGDALSMPVRIASICDVYDAVTSVRPYKEAWSAKTAYARMWQWEGQFDRVLLGQFFASIGVTALTEKAP